MTNFTKLSAVVLGGTLLTLTAFSAVASAHPKGQDAEMPAKHRTMDGKHKDMMEQRKMDHDMMSKMDMSKMDMSKLSGECQTMMTKMKTKMAEKHADGEKHSEMKDHDMSKKDHDMSKTGDHEKMKDHSSEKMKAKMATHKTCMAEMKEAMPHEH